jgi:hypothetical protein
VIVGESTDAEVTEALESLKQYVGIPRVDGSYNGLAWVLRWSGVSPETRDNLGPFRIVRTRHWERYVQVVKLALRVREPVRLALPSKPVRRAVSHGSSVLRRPEVAAR